MELSFYGADCILVATKQLQLLINPSASNLAIKHDVALFHNHQQPPAQFKDKEHFNIDTDGEYEIKGVAIQGIAAQQHVDKADDPKAGVIYVVEAAGVRLLATGNIAPELSDQQADAIGEVNVMVVPVGGHGLTLDANAAASLVGRFEPQFVVPVHYDDGVSKYPMPQDKLQSFLKEMGSESVKPVPKLKINAKELGENTEIVVLEISK